MIDVSRYDDLFRFIQKFREGFFDLLIVQSRGGLGKSFNTNRILNGSVLKINSHMTPLGLYEELFKNRDLDVWMDDVENLFANDKTVGICKQLCETHPEKEICYLTSWNMLKTRKVPKRFKTASKVLMTINNVQRLQNAGIQALLDRGLFLNFCPSPKEVSDYVRSNFDSADEEVLVFLSGLKSFGLRDYVKCSQLKRAGFDDWKKLYLGGSKANNGAVGKLAPKNVSKPKADKLSGVALRAILEADKRGLSVSKTQEAVFRLTREKIHFNTISSVLRRHRHSESLEVI